LIEINRANPLSRLFSTLLERVRGIGSCRFTTSKVSLWQILLQNDFERVVTKLLFKEAMDDARLFQVVRLLDSGAPLGFDCRAFVIVRLDRRDLVWINVTENPTAEWIARQITEAFPWDDARNTSFVIGIGKIRARPAVFESRIQNAWRQGCAESRDRAIRTERDQSRSNIADVAYAAAGR